MIEIKRVCEVCGYSTRIAAPDEHPRGWGGMIVTIVIANGSPHTLRNHDCCPRCVAKAQAYLVDAVREAIAEVMG